VEVVRGSLLRPYKAWSNKPRVTKYESEDDPATLASGFRCSIPRLVDSEAPLASGLSEEEEDARVGLCGVNAGLQ
jgi:hypothetical protein